MATKKKLLQAAAGTAAASGGAGGLNVEDVFSTYLYEGNGSSKTIQNGINLGQAFGSSSMEFSGSQNYITTPSTISLSGDFTVEAWVFPRDLTGKKMVYSSPTDSNVQIRIQENGGVYMYVNGTTLDAGTIATNLSNLDTWHHIAVTRSSGTVRAFVNGTQTWSTSFSSSFGLGVVGTFFLSGGYYSNPAYDFDGYISNARIVTGSALYTSNFTPSTSELTAVSGTQLLIGQGSTPFTDNSSNAYTMTTVGTISEETSFGPFDAAEAGEGGLVWIKARNANSYHSLWDTERGVNKAVFSHLTNAESNYGSNTLTSFNSNGISLGSSGIINDSVENYASWTFRKAPKFFTCLTYTGTGSAQNISHDLGSDVGFLLIKRTDSTSNWRCWHRGLPGTGSNMEFNQTGAYETATAIFNGTDPTSTQFSVGTNSNVNASGGTYVAYLFAHNDGDGTFGPTGDQDIIKCGYWDSVVNQRVEVDLGFEPQFVIIKGSSYASDWRLFDNMRGITDGDDAELQPHTSNAETNNTNRLNLTSTGFSSNLADGSSGNRHIYIAIRRGPMAVPTDATDVFTPELGDGSSDPGFNAASSPIDFFIRHNRSGASPLAGSRLTGRNYLNTSNTAAESTSTTFDFDYMNGFYNSSSGTTEIAWMWKRAPSFCDVVAYTGNGTSGRTVSHNLGVAPEMMWVKKRNEIGAWPVYHVGAHATSPENYFLQLNSTITATLNSARWNNTAPTATEFTVGNGGTVNDPNDTYIAYLFASLDGVSKVGSYTGSNSDQDIDCGFTSGARFVLIKRYSTTGSWYVFDTERGIVVGADGTLVLNDTGAESSEDKVYPYSGGFGVKGNLGQTNQAGSDYIFYAIA